MNCSSTEGTVYTRNGGANQKYLQERIASLEGGKDCIGLASGVAALSGLFFAMLESGDPVVFSSVAYIAVYRLLNELFKNKFNVETTIVDTTDLEAVKAAIRPDTKLVHIETPGNPALGIADIEAIAKIVHENGALLGMDNSFASPFNQRPIEFGTDFVIESLTKYINGHGDAMGGAISPFNAWLIMRCSVTLPPRMRQHNENAQKVAEWLEAQPCVSFVSYPGLKSHKEHEIARKQVSTGFGGVLSFGLKTDHDTHNRFVSYLKVITSAVSLGHDESLIVFLDEDDDRQCLYPEEFHNVFFRFSVGIEDVAGIIENLRQALEKAGLPTAK